ncbi:MmgE/PrpD family protein [Comamonas endophytica]|uniref:MmgE/PrpD family protein n=1 Tax=Comamonas endophytica TaxID=2949090 RepID=A0ABY6GGF3_9BURK|nr:MULTISPECIES: MmgE/PrpD family protein [unclassified Acidovorax]MCD2513246.1 MmgE/PrpD family protein [Acidovorax sp. D4N7]UYG53410.1 MmgE/PrpD family protein [Acidovorax sp. 5MLIR]
MHVSETLGHFGASFHSRPVAAQVIHHAKRAVVDWYAALIAGYAMNPTPLLERAMAEDLDRGLARLALGRKATVKAAALIHGTASHAAEVDDIFKHAIYHPGAPTISAALAVAQQVQAGGEEFLRAVIVGYEVSTRIGQILGRAHYRYWHNTGTAGTFGAAAAAAYLLRLDPAQSTHALCTAATFAAGLQQAFQMDSMSKPLHSGRAAEAGVAAAAMAQQGVTGSLDVFEGRMGMGVAMSDAPDWQPVLADLGQVFNICAMTFKNHSCCGHTFAPIDGALALQQAHGFNAADIAEIKVATYAPALAVAGNPQPATAAEARFSIPYVVATALLHGSVRLAAFDAERLADPALRALMQRVVLEVHPELDQQFPGQRAARVDITLKDGTRHGFLQPTRKGDPDLPLTDEDLQSKLVEFATPVLGADGVQSVSRQLWALETAPDLTFL